MSFGNFPINPISLLKVVKVKIIAQPSDNVLSKVDIEKFGFHSPVGSTIKIAADFYINSNVNLTDLFLIDLECCSCWDSTVPENQCPGIRLKIGGDNEYLSIERGKIISRTISQSEVSFPIFEWVSIVWEWNYPLTKQEKTNSL